MTAATPAEYGASWLDEHTPGWARRVELAKFDMSCPCRCVLGQLYSRGNTTGYSIYFTLHGQEFMERLGFDITSEVDAFGVIPAFEALTSEWRNLIVTRQTKTTTTETSPQEVTT